MGTRKANRRKAEKREDSRLAVVTVSAVIMCMAVASGIKVSSLRAKAEVYQERVAILESEVEKERDRAAEMEQYRVYVQSNAFMEKTAKEKLGLVNPGEIILEPEQ